MATPHHYAIPSSVSAVACPTYDADHVQAPSCPPGATSTTAIDTHDLPSLPAFAVRSSANDLNAPTNDQDIPMFVMAQPKSALDWLYRLVAALTIQISIIASVVVSLKDRITAVEGAQIPVFVRAQETEALRQQVSELCERVASQQDRIKSLETSQHAEMVAYKKGIRELATKMDDTQADGVRKSHDSDDALEKLRQSLEDFQITMECQRARVTGIKADVALKIHLLQKEMAGIQTDLAAVKMVAVPANVLSAGEVAKNARKTGMTATVDQGMEVAKEMKELCPLPPIVGRRSACSIPEASTPLTALNDSDTKETKVRDSREPLAIAHNNVGQPGAVKVPARSAIPAPKIPIGGAIPAKGNGEQENKACKSSTKMTVQYTKPSKPSAGRVLDVVKSSAASSEKAQSGTGTSSSVSALPKPRKSILPALRKSLLPGLAKHAAVVDGSSSKEVKKASRPPGGSQATQTKQPTASKISAIITSKSPSESSSSSTVENGRSAAGIPASSSLAALDAALEAMQMEGDDLLMQIPPLNTLYGDPGFSRLASAPTRVKGKAKNENVHVAAKESNVGVKPARSPLRSTLARTQAVNSVTLPASLSLAALDAAVQLQGERDVLALMPVPDYRHVDLSISTPVAPIFIAARPHCARESIYVSPVRTTAARPSRRL